MGINILSIQVNIIPQNQNWFRKWLDAVKQKPLHDAVLRFFISEFAKIIANVQQTINVQSI